MFLYPFQDGGRFHIETSPLICGANQWTGFYMVTASALKGLKKKIFRGKREKPSWYYLNIKNVSVKTDVMKTGCQI